MGHEPKTIRINSAEDIARLLGEADKTPLLLEQGGHTYRLSREDLAVYADADAITAAFRRTRETTASGDAEAAVVAQVPSPEKVAIIRESIHKAAGSWREAGVDAEAFKAYITERRRRSSRPPIVW